jgi:hypothetical protein
MDNQKLARLNWLKDQIRESERQLQKIVEIKYHLTPTNDPEEAPEGSGKITLNDVYLTICTRQAGQRLIQIPFNTTCEFLDRLETLYRISIDVLQTEFNQS